MIRTAAYTPTVDSIKNDLGNLIATSSVAALKSVLDRDWKDEDRYDIGRATDSKGEEMKIEVVAF